MKRLIPQVNRVIELLGQVCPPEGSELGRGSFMEPAKLNEATPREVATWSQS